MTWYSERSGVTTAGPRWGCSEVPAPQAAVHQRRQAVVGPLRPIETGLWMSFTTERRPYEEEESNSKEALNLDFGRKSTLWPTLT